MKEETKKTVKIVILLLLPSPIIAIILAGWGIQRLINKYKKGKTNDDGTSTGTNGTDGVRRKLQERTEDGISNDGSS